MVLAPTVSSHGAVLDTVPAAGPALPAEQTTVTPCLAAWKDPMATPSRKYSAGVGGSPQRDGEHVHAVVDGRVERRDDVGVEALAAVDGVPAHLVRRGVRRGAPPLAVPLP